MAYVSLSKPLHAIVCGLSCVVLTATTHAQVPAQPGWDLVWNDEFDGTSVDTARWDVLSRKDSFNNEKQYYRPTQVTVANGELTITAIDVPFGGKQYQSGLVRTWQEDLYGRWEVRANLPTSQGMWPAIWLLPRTVDWPLGGEIDIMENRGSEPFKTSSAYHWQANPGPCCDQRELVFDEYQPNPPVNFHEGYHDYAVEWEADQIRYYVDDNLHFTVDNPGALLDVPMSLIINLAVGGDFGGDPNGTTVWPQTFDIEYARFWKAAGAPIPGDIDGDGFVGIGDLNIVLGEWNQSTQVGSGVLLSDFSSFNLTGTYAQWDGGSFTAGASDFRVQANDFGGGWKNLAPALDASGETELRVQLDVNPGNVADKFNIVLIDGDGTERVYRFDSLTVGDDQLLTIDLANFLQDNAAGAVPGLDLSDLTAFHTQGTFANGDPGLAMDLTFDNLSIGNVGGPALLGDVNGDGFVGIDDLNLILGNWNAGTPPNAGGAIPEPGTFVLLGLGGMTVLRRRVTDVS